jgi:hypothetical protein
MGDVNDGSSQNFDLVQNLITLVENVDDSCPVIIYKHGGYKLVVCSNDTWGQNDQANQADEKPFSHSAHLEAADVPDSQEPLIPGSPGHTHVQKMKCHSSKFSLCHLLRIYFNKMRGTGQSPPKRDGIFEILLCFCASFTSIAILSAIDFYFLLSTKFTTIIPAFAAMAVLLFTDTGSKLALAQPRNVFFGHVLSAVIGLTCQTVIGQDMMWLSAPLSVAVTIAVMSLTHTVHPAAGATALACIYGGPRVTGAGWWFVLVTVAGGSIVMILFAMFMNNLSPRRRYPLYWH